ncbi:MAG: hypothetical protein APG12_01064 [Candidatus Methanofastidiosum methylothiophilum]|uniref:Uncharacterized protein n=1 Tax=Candidatus Methanofastidiosum methylothiophilum TaxID=1705564 RepID=A0A150ITC7_9EURY|nr:MAG: hypothetical protein APG10_00607 [Candidatus Methanofastidiosum methylthiophilus]KYC47904.1 MAG: hypothetical protein APG11_00783 [Candidatus Methanofastidiosum methylthiophilus]KYC50071.1 MAG: hypothetical protein APG12_01064 [Candidatus Methanofastidiosum methylthiophilus]
MKKKISISIGILLLFSFLGTTSVLSEDCVSVILEKDTLKVGDNFFVCPSNATINENISTGCVELVAINGNFCVYKAKTSGTIVFEHCDTKVTVRIFPKETPFGALMNLLGRGKN